MGQGRADVAVQTASGFTGGYSECWDAAACVTWVNDPLDFTGICVTPLASCIRGTQASCAVP